MNQTRFTEAEREAGYRTVGSTETNGVVLGDFEVTPNFRERNHEHDFPHLVLVLDGWMAEHATGGEERVGVGMVRASGPATHDLQIGPNGIRCLVLELPAWKQWTPDFPALKTCFSAQPEIVLAARRMQRHLSQGGAPSLLLELDAIELFTRFGRSRSPRRAAPPSWLERVRQLLADAVPTPDIRDVAREAGVHPNHVIRAFRQHYGVSSSSFVRRTRAQRAASAIASGSRPLVAIAHESGYCDQSHMTREIRAFLGTTPTRLRAQASQA